MTHPPATRPPLLSDPENVRLVCQHLKATGAATYSVWEETPSMFPTLRKGWKLHVRSVPASELRIGDICIFVHRDQLKVHRLIWKKEEEGRERYLLQGDNNPEREMVEADAILGRVDAAEGEWNRDGIQSPVKVGNDSRALFYRTAFRLHSLLARIVPAAAVPDEGTSGGPAYRCLRTCFRLLESLFSPRPRR